MENKEELGKLVQQLEKSNRQQVFYARLQAGFSAAAFVLCLIVAIAVIKVLPQVQEMAGRAEVVLTNLETVTEELTAVDMAGMVESVDSLLGNVDSLVGDVDTLVESSQASLEDTMASVNKIDFETLNDAIEDLAAVIEPLANFFGMFGR